MCNYVGLDVSLKTTSICILDEKGKRLLEGEEDSTPEAVSNFLQKTGLEIEQIGLERVASNLSRLIIDLLIAIGDFLRGVRGRI